MKDDWTDDEMQDYFLRRANPQKITSQGGMVSRELSRRVMGSIGLSTVRYLPNHGRVGDLLYRDCFGDAACLI